MRERERNRDRQTGRRREARSGESGETKGEERQILMVRRQKYLPT